MYSEAGGVGVYIYIHIFLSFFFGKNPELRSFCVKGVDVNE